MAMGAIFLGPMTFFTSGWYFFYWPMWLARRRTEELHSFAQRGIAIDLRLEHAMMHSVPTKALNWMEERDRNDKNQCRLTDWRIKKKTSQHWHGTAFVIVKPNPTPYPSTLNKFVSRGVISKYCLYYNTWIQHKQTVPMLNTALIVVRMSIHKCRTHKWMKMNRWTDNFENKSTSEFDEWCDVRVNREFIEMFGHLLSRLWK